MNEVFARRRVAEGIRADRYGYEAHVKVAGQTISKRFPLSERLDTIRCWREATRADRIWTKRLEAEAAGPKWRTPPKGCCYVYFLRSGSAVKIGRAADPQARLRKLQTGHSATLELLVAVVAHKSLETALHERFERHRLAGEWFPLNEELVAAIEHLRAGRNPHELLW